MAQAGGEGGGAGGEGGGAGGEAGGARGESGGPGGANWELVAVAAAQEETTFGGSRTSAFSLEPDAAIVVDVTHATDAPGIEVKESGKHPLGSGPVLSRGSTLHPRLFELLHDTASPRGHPLHGRGDRPQHRHRRRRGAPQPRRGAHRAGVGPYPLHALPGGAGRARRRARRRTADRRRGAHAGRRDVLRAVGPDRGVRRHRGRGARKLHAHAPGCNTHPRGRSPIRPSRASRARRSCRSVR